MLFTHVSDSTFWAFNWSEFSASVLHRDSAAASSHSVVVGVYILIAAGGLVMLVGFFGCCGAVRESQCLLGSVSYFFFLVYPEHVFLSIFFSCLYFFFLLPVLSCSVTFP